MKTRESRRYLGIELSGAKNQKTVVSVLENYPKEQKVFLLDIFEKIIPSKATNFQVGGHPGSDLALLELIEELDDGGIARIGVNVALELPPCLLCNRKKCSPEGHCDSPAVKWMHAATRKAQRASKTDKSIRVREFTAYTQRPVELWVRYNVLPRLPEWGHFEIDETLGGNKAPLVARMAFLKRHLAQYSLVEAWPKLSVAVIGLELGIPKRTLMSYRQLEEGIHAREEILERLAEQHGIFIYERDIRKLAHSLAAFDSFFCAYTSLLSDTGRTEKAPAGFPLKSGWVAYPELET